MVLLSDSLTRRMPRRSERGADDRSFRARASARAACRRFCGGSPRAAFGACTACPSSGSRGCSAIRHARELARVAVATRASIRWANAPKPLPCDRGDVGALPLPLERCAVRATTLADLAAAPGFRESQLLALTVGRLDLLLHDLAVAACGPRVERKAARRRAGR